MADLSKKEWENYEQPGHSKVFKNISTVMQKGISATDVADYYSDWANNQNEYEKVRVLPLRLDSRMFCGHCRSESDCTFCAV